MRMLSGTILVAALLAAGCSADGGAAPRPNENGSEPRAERAMGASMPSESTQINGGASSPDRAANAPIATLGGGCFWCLEAYFERIDGIGDVVSGYSGGQVEKPSYDAVSSGRTGHAEVVQFPFDPAKISYREILEIFFTMHDPTTRDRQGADHGTQYRSIILTHSPEQAADAAAVIEQFTAQQIYEQPIVTQVVPFTAFYPAEISHQDYYARNPQAGYCRVVIDPKVRKLREKFAHRLKRDDR